MNVSHNDRGPNATEIEALQALNSLQPPAGMHERVLSQLAGHARQPTPRGLRKYAFELWAGVAAASVLAALMLGFLMLQTHRAAHPAIEANMAAPKIAPSPATAVQAGISFHAATHAHRAPRNATAVIPHTPPPQPLTAQERLLLTLANTPSLAAGVAKTQTISQHGLGANALFELDHEQLKPMPAESRLLQPLQPMPQNLP